MHRNRTSLAFAIVLTLMGPVGISRAQSFVPASTDQTPTPTTVSPRFDYTVGFGAEYSDNIALTDTDTIGQSVLIPRMSFTFNQQGSTIQAQAVGQIEYRDYLQGDFSNEFRGQLSGVLNWTISPQRLNFAVQDYSSVEPINTLASNAPSNLQQTNVFVTGPTLLFRLGGSLRGQADLRYTNTTASENKEFDSQRGMAALRLLRDLSATDQLSGNVEFTHVDFSNVDPLVTPQRYNNYSIYGRYVSHLAHVDIDLALGWSHLDFTSGWQDQSGVLARATLGWRMTTRSTLQLDLANQFGDAANDLIVAPTTTGQQLTNLQAGSNVINADVFREQRAALSYLYQGARFAVTIAPFYNRHHYLADASQDQNAHGILIGTSYRLNPLMTLGADASDQTTNYSGISRRDENLGYGINFTQQLTSHWNWRVDLIHNQRHSTVLGAGYDENEILAVLNYTR